YNDIRARGLCHRCKQPFGPLHRCSEKVFKLIEVEDDELEETLGDVELIRLIESDLILKEKAFVENAKKFGRTSIEYLGHILSVDRVSMDLAKVARALTVVRGFLGLTGYYRKFVRNYGQIARPLIDLDQRSTNGVLGVVVRADFGTRPSPFRFHKPFIIECNTSGLGVGAVLMQVGHPIAFSTKVWPEVCYLDRLMKRSLWF
ncbi:hypothetical protein V2J09_009283, partial [Rumex salicifolius]